MGRKGMLVELAMKRHKQAGLALLVLVFILALLAVAYLIRSLNPVEINNDRDKKTTRALMEAKTALLNFAASRNLTPGTCTTNCPRPGDLPCPDTNNDGVAESSCGNAVGTTGQAARLGRLPWRTLGLSDLRDGDGERLWYAVGNPYKNSTRFFPLNSDTKGTITLRDAKGAVLYDGTADGLAAVIISPGTVLVRQDAVQQVRDAVNQNSAVNYLDIALGEDNQAFNDGSANGFIMGPVKNGVGATILNDRVLAVTSDEMNSAMETRVLAEVRESLASYYSGPGASSYPRPAYFNDTLCFGNANILAPDCGEGTLMTYGRIPANPATPWGATSILRGTSSNNWFQLNAWREVIYYAVSGNCVTGTAACAGGGDLTLNNALVAPSNTKEVVLVAAGKALGVQVRVTIADKSDEDNYLENENLFPLDDVYTRTMPLTTNNNDRTLSQP